MPTSNKQQTRRKFKVEVRFARHASIWHELLQTDHFAAASETIEATFDRWPTQRPINLLVYARGGEPCVLCYRVTRMWSLVEDETPYQESAYD